MLMGDNEDAEAKVLTLKPDQYRVRQTKEDIDLKTARVILQAVIDAREYPISASSLPDKIANYSIELVRCATELVTDDLMNTHNAASVNYQRELEKNTPEGKLTILLDQPGTPPGNVGRRIDCELNHGEIRYHFPLAEPVNDNYKNDFGFTDIRGETRKISLDCYLCQTEKEFNIDNYRLWVKGLRWMSANLLNWNNPAIIMPEQLDIQPSPTAQSAQLLTHS